MSVNVTLSDGTEIALEDLTKVTFTPLDGSTNVVYTLLEINRTGDYVFYVFDESGVEQDKYSFQEEKESSLENNWSTIEGFALENKRMVLFNLWIEEQYDKVYVKINPIY